MDYWLPLWEQEQDRNVNRKVQSSDLNLEINYDQI